MRSRLERAAELRAAPAGARDRAGESAASARGAGRTPRGERYRRALAIWERTPDKGSARRPDAANPAVAPARAARTPRARAARARASLYGRSSPGDLTPQRPRAAGDPGTALVRTAPAPSTADTARDLIAGAPRCATAHRRCSSAVALHERGETARSSSRREPLLPGGAGLGERARRACVARARSRCSSPRSASSTRSRSRRARASRT